MNGTRYASAAAIADVVCWSVATYVGGELVEALLAAGAGAEACESSPSGSCTSTPDWAARDAILVAASDVVAPAVTELGTGVLVDETGGHGLQPKSSWPCGVQKSFSPPNVVALPPTITFGERSVGTTVTVLAIPSQAQGPSLMSAVLDSCAVALDAIDLATASAFASTLSKVFPLSEVQRPATVTSPTPSTAEAPPAVPSKTTALMHVKWASASAVAA